MARVKLSEYRAKKILLGDVYNGIQISSGVKASLPKKGMWVVKVDQGIKKRFKQGLVKVKVSPQEAVAAIKAWEKKGFTQFLLEPFFEHDSHEEHYLSLERVRDGFRILFAAEGGVHIEEHSEKVVTLVVHSVESVSSAEKRCALPHGFLAEIISTCTKNHIAFLEINPLVIKGGVSHLLDAACLVDSAGAYFVKSWSEADVVKTSSKHAAEVAIEELSRTTPASLKLSVLNPNGSLFLLLSGGGGSIVIADEAHALGAGKELGNYGEYSGGPSREETYLYTQHVLKLMLSSKAKKKALVIAGGVANFTDIQKTFAGVIDALTEVSVQMRKQHIKVFVRRGGPNELNGLAHMRAFLEREELLGAVYGSTDPITAAITDAVAYTRI